jgi:hypothetical protein
MSFNIEPRLQTIMDHHVAIGCHTFAKDEPETERVELEGFRN